MLRVTMVSSCIKYCILLSSVCACKKSPMDGEVDSSSAFVMVQLRASEVVEQVRHERAVETTEASMPVCQYQADLGQPVQFADEDGNLDMIDDCDAAFDQGKCQDTTTKWYFADYDTGSPHGPLTIPEFCSVCGQCIAPSAPTPQTPYTACGGWCATNTHDWGNKCSWTDSCAGCSECSSVCPDWCEANEQAWSTKCSWMQCDVCDSCAPTPVPPTPSPTDTSGGFGDPHMVNIVGEHFNIWRLGEVELLRIPRNPMYRTQIRFVAMVSDEQGEQSDNSCTRAPYMTAMRLSGSLFGNQELFIRMVAGEMRVHVGSKSLSPLENVPIKSNLTISRPSEALVSVQAGNATINVMHDAFFKPYFYLNTEARNLGSLGYEVGGILGLDDHTVVAQKPASCEKQFVSVPHNAHGSHATASLRD